MKLRIGFTAPICFAIASSTARFCSGEIAGDSHTRRSSSLSCTASHNGLATAAARLPRQSSARESRPPGRERNDWQWRPYLLAVLSQLLDELAHQRVVGRFVHAKLPRRQVHRQRRGIALQLAAGVAGDGGNFRLGALNHLLLVFLRGVADALFFRRGFALGRSA